jgi:hypothetical protein
MSYVKKLLIIEDNKQKWFISLLSGILFCLIASEKMYKFTGKIVKSFTKEKVEINGKPTKLGLFIHTVVFILLARFLMEFNFFK